MANRRQLFVIPAETWAALDADEVKATVEAMKEAKVYALPYSEVDLWIGASAAVRFLRTDVEASSLYMKFARMGLLEPTIGPGQTEAYAPANGFEQDMWLEVVRLSLQHADCKRCVVIGSSNRFMRSHRTENTSGMYAITPAQRDMFASALIVLLATRNVKKTTVRDKLVALGIGKKTHRYEYVTTISLPTEADAVDADGEEPHTEGKAKRPHLRRGHVRRQKYGPKFSLCRTVFIEPVFVNADKDWVDKRERYNVSL